jgi:ABC-type bacteriocin/lantibiotic exporter with double-glycine peptidase domain
MKMARKKTILGSKLLWKNYFGSKLKLGFILVVGWLASISTFAITIIIGAFFELHFHTATNRSSLMKNLGVEFSSLKVFFLAFALILLIKAILGFVEKQLVHNKAEGFIKEAQQLLFKKQMFWSSAVFEEKSYGKYLLRFSGDLGSIKNMLVNGIHRGMKDLLFLATGLVLMFSINNILTWIVILVAMSLSPLILFMDQIQRPKTIEKSKRKSILLDFVTRSFANHRDIGSSNKRNRTIRKFNSRLNTVFKANLNYQKLENIRQIIGPTVSNILILTLLYSIYQFSSIQVSPGELLVYLLILANVTSPLKNIIKTPGIIRKGMISLNKIEGMINKKRSRSFEPSSDIGNEIPSIHQAVPQLRISKDIMG